MTERAFQDLKIGVIGAGAIGGICAGFIKEAGLDVQVVCRSADQASRIREKGIRITGIRGELTVMMDAVNRIEDLAGDRDIILLAMKATDMSEAAVKLKSRLAPGSVAVSLQNGFCEDALGEILGRDRVIGCVTAWGATLHDPSHLEMTSTGDFIVGAIDKGGEPHLEPVRHVLNTVVEAKISDNIRGELYSKLIINSCITSVGAICGLCLGPMLAQKKARLIYVKIMEEAMAVAAALRIQVEVFAGKLDYYAFLKEKGGFADFKKHLFLRMMGFKYRKLKSSTLQSLERGRPTEIEYLTGFITSNAKKLGIETPVNTQVYQMVREIEQGRRQIVPENLEEIVL